MRMCISILEESWKEEMICIEDRVWNPNDSKDDTKKVIWRYGRYKL